MCLCVCDEFVANQIAALKDNIKRNQDIWHLSISTHLAFYTNNTTLGQEEDTSPSAKRSAATLKTTMLFSMLITLRLG